MTRPHLVEGKARTRKPEVLRELTGLLIAHGLYFTVGGEPSGITGKLPAELRRSLRDTRGGAK